jgi:DnaJ-domain-containing protein 1
MPTFIAGLFALYLILTLIKRFGRMTPADAARLVRKGGGALGLAGMALATFRGRFGLLGLLASALLGLATKPQAGTFGGAFRPVGGGSRISRARSMAIEMQLDLDSGAMDGEVLAGPYQRRQLNAMSRSECLSLYDACRRDDADGARLLETYLDRRFAGWREADEGEPQGRGGARGDGCAMTRDEAYDVLGLPKGADAEEIIRAHRGLMKKLHPDHGGSTALAARVNQAKDVLLNRHG